MGYACPVCGDPQADAEHLANHLAFSAMLRDADGHESWLDEHVPDWADRDETGLADAVTDHAEPTEFPQVFEDTVDREHSHDHDDERSGALFDDDPDFAADAREKAASQRDLGDDAEDILQEAREMTEAMLEGAGDGDSEGTDAPDTEESDEAETE